MARKPPPTSRRAAPTKVSKPFPTGTVLGSVLLAALLIGLVGYAFANQGEGVRDLVRNPDAAIEGVQVADTEDLGRGHVAGAVEYESVPPNGGDHNTVPQSCAVYDEPIPSEHAVHSLEHGAVWITYNDELPDDQVEELASKVEGDPYGLMSPVLEQESPIVLTAWGRTLELDSADDGRIDDFIEGYASGPQTPERGAACIGNTSTGQLAPAPVAPAPDASAVPSAAPSAAAPEASAVPSPAG
ncbi:hypothetical protein BH24ACT10_BH24ACT10_07560 [soil metagenome]